MMAIGCIEILGMLAAAAIAQKHLDTTAHTDSFVVLCVGMCVYVCWAVLLNHTNTKCVCMWCWVGVCGWLNAFDAYLQT
jgi:hypothetical protein